MDANLFNLPNVLLGLIVFSGVSFIFFGLSCLFSRYMVVEFERYGLKDFRTTNGYLQILGGLALLVGLYYIPLALTASSGLTLLMTAGLVVRLRIKDGFVKSFPALFYLLLNLSILVWIVNL